MSLETLQAFASQVGVGYAGLGQEALKEKILREGF